MEYNGHRILIIMFCSLIISSVDILSSEAVDTKEKVSNTPLVKVIVKKVLTATTPQELLVELLRLNLEQERENFALNISNQKLSREIARFGAYQHKLSPLNVVPSRRGRRSKEDSTRSHSTGSSLAVRKTKPVTSSHFQRSRVQAKPPAPKNDQKQSRFFPKGKV